MNTYTFTLDNGTALTLRPKTAEGSGNTWWTVTSNGKAPSKFGIPVDALGTTLPKAGTLTGPGLKAIKVKTEDYFSMSGKPAVRATVDVEIDGTPKVFSFAVSDKGSGQWNLTKASIHGKAGRQKGAPVKSRSID